MKLAGFDPRPDRYRAHPELLTLTRVFGVGETQTHGVVTFSLNSIELFDDGWRARVRIRIEAAHPIVAAEHEETRATGRRLRALGRPMTTEDMPPPVERPFPRTAAEAHDDLGTSYWTHGPSGGTSGSPGQASIGDLDFTFGPAVPSDARRLVFTIVRVPWVKSSQLHDPSVEPIHIDDGPWAWTVML